MKPSKNLQKHTQDIIPANFFDTTYFIWANEKQLIFENNLKGPLQLIHLFKTQCVPYTIYKRARLTVWHPERKVTGKH